MCGLMKEIEEQKSWFRENFREKGEDFGLEREWQMNNDSSELDLAYFFHFNHS